VTVTGKPPGQVAWARFYGRRQGRPVRGGRLWARGQAGHHSGVSETDWLLVAWCAVAAANAVPAFAPPTTALLAYFRLAHGLPILPLAIGGAVAAGVGRLGLGFASRRAAKTLPEENRRNAMALVRFLDRGAPLRTFFVFVYAMAPLPSNALFIAAGACGLPLVPTMLAFVAGRAVAEAFWISVVDRLVEPGGSPLSYVTDPEVLLTNVFGLVVLIAVFRLPWRHWIGDRQP